MIESIHQESPRTVGSHYDDLDLFYREIWGDHVHHGYWQLGTESIEEATSELLIQLLKDIFPTDNMKICDIGCGYGETSRYLAERYNAHVTGYTVSEAQYKIACSKGKNTSSTNFVLENWLENRLESNSFHLAVAIESSEHMPDLSKFFTEVYRVLMPGGHLKICAWLTKSHPSQLEKTLLLQPICTEGRLRMGTVDEYQSLMESVGFKNPRFIDATANVKKTWTLCLRRALAKLLTDRKYIRFMMSPNQNKSFLKSLVRICLAYETKSMIYGFFSATK